MFFENAMRVCSYFVWGKSNKNCKKVWKVSRKMEARLKCKPRTSFSEEKKIFWCAYKSFVQIRHLIVSIVWSRFLIQKIFQCNFFSKRQFLNWTHLQSVIGTQRGNHRKLPEMLQKLENGLKFVSRSPRRNYFEGDHIELS